MLSSQLRETNFREPENIAAGLVKHRHHFYLHGWIICVFISVLYNFCRVPMADSTQCRATTFLFARHIINKDRC